VKISNFLFNGDIKFVSLSITFPIMSINKPIFILGTVLMLLSCHKAPKPEITTTFDTQFEILNGKVKELTETHKTKSNNLETDITTFDKNGNATQTLEIGGSCENCTVNYSYKYDNNGKKSEITLSNGERHVTYKCDKNGRPAELNVKADEYSMAATHIYKYDNTGNRIESDSYQGKERSYSTKFRYNGQHLLMVTDELEGGKKLAIRAVSSYKAFDGKSNWLKRVNNEEYYFSTSAGDSQPVVRKDTTTRKITYY
jgi:hypothetical protein